MTHKGSAVNETVGHWISLAFPILFLLGGLLLICTGLIESLYDRFPTPLVKKSVGRVLHIAMGLSLIGVGCWLLYHWFREPALS